MSKLIPINYGNQRIMTTSIIAEEYEVTERKITDNFNNNKERYQEGKHYFLLQGKELKQFKSDNENFGFAQNINKLYLWTEKGALLHAKSLNTDRAWQVYDYLVDNYFNAKQNIIPAGVSKELQAIFMLDGKQQQFEKRLVDVENNMTIDYSQQESLRELGNKKVTAILGGTDAPAYKELNKKVFASFWRDYKRKLGVNSYKNTLVKDYEIGRQAIINWQPTKEILFMIKGCNSQIRM